MRPKRTKESNKTMKPEIKEGPKLNKLTLKWVACEHCGKKMEKNLTIITNGIYNQLAKDLIGMQNHLRILKDNLEETTTEYHNRQGQLALLENILTIMTTWKIGVQSEELLPKMVH